MEILARGQQLEGEQPGQAHRALPKAGEFYRHFKGNLYQVIGVAHDAETLEPMVVYWALDGQGRWYVRALEEFLSPVDREKYPDSAAAYRFERVQPEGVLRGGQIAPLKAEEPDKDIPVRTPDARVQNDAAAGVANGNVPPDTGAGVMAQDMLTESIPMREIRKDTPLQEQPVLRAGAGTQPDWSNPEAEKVRPELLRFLDAETPGEKLAVLREIRGKLDEGLMTNIELSIDLMPDERESLERRLSLVEKNLEKRVRYEGTRLR